MAEAAARERPRPLKAIFLSRKAENNLDVKHYGPGLI